MSTYYKDFADLDPSKNGGSTYSQAAQQRAFDAINKIVNGAGGTRNMTKELMDQYLNNGLSLEDLQQRLQTGTGGAGTVYDPSKGPQMNSGAGNVPWVPGTGSTTSTTPSAGGGPGTPGYQLDMATPGATGVSGPGITSNLGPGSNGADVKKLQDWLVSKGYMTQAQVNTGYGTYGPQTTAAVTAMQKAMGIDPQGNPGYFGPITQQALAGGAGNAGGSGGNQSVVDQLNGMGSVGQQLAAALGPLQDAVLKLQQGGQIPPGLQITPALTQQFLAWAHQVVDPQTQQLINQHITAINSNLQQAQTDYQNQQAGVIQDFGTNLATEQNQAGASGTAFSGQRNLNEQNMAASTNRTLSSLAADTQNAVGQNLNAAAAQVGSANAGQFNLPSLTQAQVGITGGQRGSSNQGNILNFNYNPSAYTMGADISTGVQNVANQQANYMNQYGTLAANSPPTRRMSDLIGGVTGLPSNYTIPSSLM